MKVVTFGEIMLRLSPPGNTRFVQADSFDVVYGGAEANVATSLSTFGLETEFVSKIPSGEIGQSAVNYLRRYGVGINHIIRSEGRLGIYYLEKGISQRPSKVIYDRANSLIALAERGDFDWEEILRGADWFHFTGITAALGGNLPEICKDALKTCKKLGVKVSCDLNYRKNLWTTEQARKTMTELIPYVDLCISSVQEAADVLGIQPDVGEILDGRTEEECKAASVARQITEKFGVKNVAVILYSSTLAGDLDWSGMLYDGGKAYFSNKHIIHIVDKVGGGDAFGAGLIYALAMCKAPTDAINFAVAAGAFKHSINGDTNIATVEEIEETVKRGF